MAESVFSRLEEAVREKRRLEEALRTITERIAELEQEALEVLADMGAASVSTPTATIYVAEDVWARPADGMEEALADALEQHGMPELARRRVMTQSLSAVVREWLRDGGMPEWAEPLVSVARVQHVRVRSK